MGTHVIPVVAGCRRLFALAIVSVFLMGCQGYLRKGVEVRTWKPTYQEQLRINTEPAGCRIYVQDEFAGTSPVEVTLDAGTFTVTQFGTYPARRAWSSERVAFAGDFLREGPTTWSGTLTPGMTETHDWRIVAVKDGYHSASRTHTVSVSSTGFRNAVANLRLTAGQKLATTFVGESALLLALSKSTAGQQQQQQQQQQTVVLPGAGGQAAEATGTVIVTSNVEGADVYVDGLFVGNTPATLSLKAGVHIVEVKKTGYSAYKREMRVLGKSEVTLRAQLEDGPGR